MASGLSTLPVEALSNSNTADKKKANVEPTSTTEAAPPTLGLTVTPPTPAVLASEAYEGGHHQHQQLQPHILGGPDRVPQSFQELDEAMGGSDDGWSVSGVDSDEFEEEEADGGQSEEMRALLAEAQAAWTDEDIDKLMHDLRENGMLSWLKKYYIRDKIPARKLLMAFGLIIPPPPAGDDGSAEDGPDLLRVLKMAISRVLRKRAKRADINTVDDVVRLIDQSSNILVLSGAGVSTSCGIPDFRSSDGIYANLRRTRPDLTDPQEMFDIHTFKQDPTLFYSFAKELYPSNFLPSPSHHFVRLLERKGKLLRNYSQNIDTLEQKAGLTKVLNCHGSFAEAECILCKHRFPGESIKESIFAGDVPLCSRCTSTPAYRLQEAEAELKRQMHFSHFPAKRMRFSHAWEDDDDDDDDHLDEELTRWLGKPLVKPTITFFGEPLSDEFDKSLFADREVVDLVLVMGTSLRVAPVSELLGHLPHSVPQILINRDPVPHHQFDVCLMGDSDAVVKHLCDRLNDREGSQQDSGVSWELPASDAMSVSPDAGPNPDPRRLGDSHIFLLKGANEQHRWLQQFDPEHVQQRRSEGGLGLPGGSSRRRSRSRSRSGSRSSAKSHSRSRSASRSSSKSARGSSNSPVKPDGGQLEGQGVVQPAALKRPRPGSPAI